MFQILIDSTSREIIGIGPFDPGTDPGAGFSIVEIADDSQQNTLTTLSPAYLCADNQTFAGTPC